MRVDRDDVRAVLVLVSVWIACGVLVDPRADVPLLDDWTYAASVEQLIAGRGFHVSPWSSTFPATQIWWGTAFAWLGGFSFTVLRLSTLLWWLLGTLGFYGALRVLGCGAAAALLGAGLMLMHPVTFVLAFSFMTDVPFVAAMCLSSWALALGVQSGRPAALGLGLALALLAFFVRPMAIALPAGLALGGWMLADARLRWHVVVAASVTIAMMGVSSVVAARFFPWAGAGGVAWRVTNLAYVLQVPPLVYLEAGLSMLAHVGLVIVPVLVATERAGTRGTRSTALALLAAALAVSWLAPSAVSALKFAHTLSVEELGAARPLLQGAPVRTTAGALVAVLATGIGLVGAAVLLARVAAGLRPGGCLRQPAWVCIGGIGHASVALCFGLWLFYDRYYLPLVPIAIALALAEAPLATRRWRQGAVVALVAALALLDVTGTRDMLAYARAVDGAAAALRARGIPDLDLDAGYAENGWRLYVHPERLPAGKSVIRDVPHVTATAEGVPYVIANAPLAGYRVLETIPVPTWWAATDRVYVLAAESAVASAEPAGHTALR